MTLKNYTISLLVVVICISCSKDSGTKTITDENGDPATVDITGNQKSVGESAEELLAADPFDSLRVAIHYVSGLKPTANTISNFESFLEDRLHKPGGITITLEEIASPGQSTYSITDILALEDQMRTAYNKAGEVAVFGLYIDGEYSENTENGSVLGVAYRNTSFVIFEETIQSFSGRPLAPSTTVLETTVLNHEFGHLLGLVNAGTPLKSDHQDVSHGRHCTVEDCLMYWTAETGEGLLNMISGGAIPTLDSQCLSDLEANGGKL